MDINVNKAYLDALEAEHMCIQNLLSAYELADAYEEEHGEVEIDWETLHGNLENSAALVDLAGGTVDLREEME